MTMQQPGGLRRQSLEDLFGASTARQAEFGNFLNTRVPGVSTAFRQFLEGRGPALNSAFGARDVTQRNPAASFGDFLAQGSGPGGGGAANFVGGGGRLSNAELSQTANNLRSGPFADSLSNTQRAAIGALSGNPIAQFQIGLAPQLQRLAGATRPAFEAMAGRNFDSILAELGLAPNFQFLPFMQQRGFDMFSRPQL